MKPKTTYCDVEITRATEFIQWLLQKYSQSITDNLHLSIKNNRSDKLIIKIFKNSIITIEVQYGNNMARVFLKFHMDELSWSLKELQCTGINPPDSESDNDVIKWGETYFLTLKQETFSEHRLSAISEFENQLFFGFRLILDYFRAIF